MFKDLPRTAPAHPWTNYPRTGARATLDPSIRRMIYGPIRPMDEHAHGLLSRLFHWR